MMLARFTKILAGVVMSSAVILTSPIDAVSGTELPKEADKAREEGNSLSAIDFYNQAIVRFQETKDYRSIMGALTVKLLAWKHLFNE